MRLLKKYNVAYNPWFLYPFLAWVIGGGILLFTFSREQLFRAINNSNNPLLDQLMYRITWMGQGEVIIPVLLVIFAIAAFRNTWYLMFAIACNIIPLVIQRVLKECFDAPRPLNYFSHASWIHIDPQWPQLMSLSFPSGHSEGAFSFFCFLSLLLPPSRRAFGLLFFLLALSVCYSRVYLAAHFFADIYVGSIIGGTITIIMFAIMTAIRKRFSPEKNTFV